MREMRRKKTGRNDAGRVVGGVIGVFLAVGAAGLGATAPAEAAIEDINPFDVNQGFTVVGTGDVVLGNGEIEGSAAAFETVSTPKDNYALIHQAAGMPDYEVPFIDGDAVRVLANQFTGTGGFDQSNRDDSGTAVGPSLTAISKFADISNLTAAARGDDFTRLTNTEGGVFDLKSLPYDASTWQAAVRAQQQVADYFGDLDTQVARTNQCLAEMYQEPGRATAPTVTGDQNQATVSGLSTTMPNWVDYEDVAGRNLTLDPSGWMPTADAPLIIRVDDPTDTVGPVSVNGWSFTPDQQQAYSRYILFDFSANSADPITVDGVEGGALWAPGSNVVVTNSRTINGQLFADDVTTGGVDGTGGGEFHHHAFLGLIPCETDTAAATFRVHKVVTGEAAELVPADTDFTVDWEVTAGPDAGQSGTLVVPADGTVVDGPQLLAGDEIAFTEGALPEVDGVVWGEARIDPETLLLDASAGTVDVEVTNTALTEPTPDPTPEPTDPTPDPTAGPPSDPTPDPTPGPLPGSPPGDLAVTGPGSIGVLSALAAMLILGGFLLHRIGTRRTA